MRNISTLKYAFNFVCNLVLAYILPELPGVVFSREIRPFELFELTIVQNVWFIGISFFVLFGAILIAGIVRGREKVSKKEIAKWMYQQPILISILGPMFACAAVNVLAWKGTGACSSLLQISDLGPLILAATAVTGIFYLLFMEFCGSAPYSEQFPELLFASLRVREQTDR